eukprot:TRINITY_DN9343_c0_g1_i1.p1 TRINITY_DN9343_c0_g1~~TRINITY_DN9343_c0_g1_i1.p1  ORF type:complete len:187 (-),score=18.19 TRINITY_DN9343_c0_g1_i1:36-596(-)
MLMIDARPRTSVELVYSSRFHNKAQSIAVSKPPKLSSTTRSKFSTIKLNSQIWVKRNKPAPYHTAMINLKHSLALRKKGQRGSLGEVKSKHIAFDNFMRELLQRNSVPAKNLPALKHLVVDVQPPVKPKNQSNNCSRPTLSKKLATRNTKSLADLKHLSYSKKRTSQIDSLAVSYTHLTLPTICSV